MRKFFKLLFPNKFFLLANCALTGVFIVMLAGMIYIKSVNATETRSGGCPPGPVPECPDDSVFEHFFPHPTDCCWFFYCMHGVAFCVKCPADLHWNVQLETCDFPSLAGCMNPN
ncbi:MAG: carbohydrate-binding module family 14 protein [Rikenellaceae bacterium]|nr:carbohydrate-binding module family 14 protein [Rikenellaceae bacterium]MCL2693455.1 carbohydrate-binding module family 14 protein [Rikenellaceae bacterium]